MKEDIIMYFVAENGLMNPEVVENSIKWFEEKDYNIKDIGMGNAYNMPSYLLGELEEHIDEAVVISVFRDREQLVPMVFADEDEINAVLKGLEGAEKYQNSFDILKEVHSKIRECSE